MLMDICSKIFSSVMNDRAFHLLELHVTQFQFGGTLEIGCQDRLFTLKALLNAQCNHNLGSYVGFVDLVKAYDMANTNSSSISLRNTTPPHTFVTAIRKIHTSNVMVLKIKK